MRLTSNDLESFNKPLTLIDQILQKEKENWFIPEERVMRFYDFSLEVGLKYP